jgi:RNA polymerase sigma-70 factor (ECF subfamily)
MEDARIVDLYWARDERAIEQSETKYGRMLRSVARGLVGNDADAEECVNDTYLDTWNAIPTARPDYLGAFMAKITRRISIDRFRREHREKRGGAGELIDELTDCVPDRSPTPPEEYENGRLRDALNRFLAAMPQENRVLFVGRYFFSKSVAELADEHGLTETNVKVRLYRLRESLRRQLGEEGLL